jgi:hypothetical protein
MKKELLVLPIGVVIYESLEPWLKWLGEQDYFAFVSFPEITEFFRQVTKSNEKADLSYCYESSYIDLDTFLNEKMLFCVNFNIFQVGGMNACLFVKFFIDGTVEVTKIDLDDSVLLGQVKSNIQQIDQAIEEHQRENKMLWKEFAVFLGQIMCGFHSIDLELPKLFENS